MIGRRIAALRRSENMSQAELARQLGISTSAVGMYEQGRREPSAEQLVKLAGIFRISTDYLLTGRPVSGTDGDTLGRILENCAARSMRKQSGRRQQPFTAQELLVLFAALLAES